LQDHLPKEQRLAGISTIEAANRWLRQTYIAAQIRASLYPILSNH
jgi:hypothetical protein